MHVLLSSLQAPQLCCQCRILLGPPACKAASMAAFTILNPEPADALNEISVAAVQGGDAGEPPAPSTPKKSRRSKRPPPASTEKQAAPSKRAKTATTSATTRKCSDCRKTKEVEEFNDDQARCKSCFNDDRALWRVAQTQKCKDQLKKLRTEDPAAFNEIFRKFIQARVNARKTGSRINFTLISFVLEWEQRKATKESEQGEFMWEGEWLEFAATAKCGYMTKEEARLEWKKMLQEEWRPSDENGPKGFTRLWVKTKDVVENSNETSFSKKLSKTETLRKPTAQQMEQRKALLFGDTGLEGHDDVDFESVRANALSSAGRAF